MPTKEVIALLSDPPENRLRQLYIDGALSIFEAYLSSGFPFLAIDPDRIDGFRLPENVPDVVDVVYITLEDINKVNSAVRRPEIRKIAAHGTVFFSGLTTDDSAARALKSCVTYYEVDVAQAIIPPVAHAIMNKVYPEQAQHFLDRTVYEEHRHNISDGWTALKRESKITHQNIDPLYEHIVSAWNLDLPIIVAGNSRDHFVVPRGMMWTRFPIAE